MSGRLAVGLLVIALLAVLVGFGALRGNVAFFASKGRLEPAAERHYRESIRRDFDTLEPLDARLDVCNVGGTIQGCYEASNAVIKALSALLRDVGAADVPSRYVDGNDALRRAVRRLRDGFKTRNHGLATYDNASFVRGNDEIEQANSELENAWARFPPDARPVP
jgi:hypothetical protein